MMCADAMFLPRVDFFLRSEGEARLDDEGEGQ